MSFKRQVLYTLFSVSLRIKVITTPSSKMFGSMAKQYFSLVVFIVLNNVVITLQSMYKILKCDNSSESY